MLFGPGRPACPSEVLFAVLCALKSVSESSTEILHCALVSKSWYDVAIPLLYSNVVISSRNIESFQKHWPVNKRYGSLIRSLTIRVGFRSTEETWTTHDVWGGTNRTSAAGRDSLAILSGELDGMPAILADLDRLNSFSFVVNLSVRHLQIRRSTLSALVAALPQSCVNLEIDTACQDTVPGAISGDLCEKIRQAMPRMHHVRLRMAYICPEILTQMSLEEQATIFSQELTSIEENLPASPDHKLQIATSTDVLYPRLRSLIVSFINPAEVLTPVRHCAHYHASSSNGLRALSSINQTIAHLTSNPHGATLVHPSAQIQIITQSNVGSMPFQGDVTSYTTTASSDPIRHIKRRFPSRCISTSIPNSVLVRDPAGTEYMTSMWMTECLTEGRTWSFTYGGTRLPRCLLRSEERDFSLLTAGCAERQPMLLTQATWQELNLGSSCPLWENERISRTTLLTGEVVEGPAFWEPEEPLKEQTPFGFARRPEEYYLRLRPVSD